MTKEQYDRAIQINKRLAELNKIKEEIKDTGKNRLTYTHENSRGNYEELYYWTMKPIGELFDKHDKMIRAEIDDEIEKLTKEIKEL